MTVSDGDHYIYAVLAEKLFLEHPLEEGCLVRMEQYVLSELAGGIKVAVISKLQVEDELQLRTIGSPKWVQEECTSKDEPKEKQQEKEEKQKEGAEGEEILVERKRKRGSAGLTRPVRRDPVAVVVPTRKLRRLGAQGKGKKKADTGSRPKEVDRTSSKKDSSYRGREKDTVGTQLERQGECPKPPSLQAKASLYRGIRFISPYLRRWKIKGRCTFKGGLREFRNRNGKGVLFNFELIDNTGSIGITAFGELAQAYFDRIRLHHVYVVSDGHLRPAHWKYNRSTSFFEMSLDENSVVQEVADDGTVGAPKQQKLVKIRDLLRTRANSYVDVLGVVEDISEVEHVFMRSSGQKVMRRTITILDDSKTSVSLILWDDKVNLMKKNEEKSGKVLLVQRARRSYYEGIRLTVGRQAIVTVNPKTEEACRLRTWYFRQTGSLGKAQFDSSILGLTTMGSPFNKDRLTLRMGKQLLSTARTVDEKELGEEKRKDGAVSFIMRGVIVEFREDITMSYESDPSTKRKIEEIAPGVWYSPFSLRNFSDDMIKRRYALWVRVADETGDAWLCAFDEAARVFLQRSADEMEETRKKDTKKWKSILSDACFRPLIMEIFAKPKTFRGETQQHLVMNRAEFVNFAREGRFVFKEIQNWVFPSMSQKV